jgi:hypothetical protein
MPAQALVKVTVNNVENPQIVYPRNDRDGFGPEFQMPGAPVGPIGIEFGLTDVEQVDALIVDLRNVRNILGA